MTVKYRVAALALFAVVSASAGPAAAQDMRRASVFDLGIYGGGAWTTDWFNIGVEGGGVFGTSNFAEDRPFDVDWSGFAGGIYGGVRVPVSPNMAVGARAGVLFFGADGTHRPFPLFEVKAEPDWAFYVDVEAVFPLPRLLSLPQPPGLPPPTVSLFIGPAYGELKVTGSTIGTAFSDSHTQGVLGFTAGGRIEIPVLPNISATGTFRYIHFPETDFSFPGTAPVDTNIVTVTGGLQLKLAESAPPRPRDRVNSTGPLTRYYFGAEAGGAFGTSHFAEASPFDIDLSGFVGGVYGGLRAPVTENLFIGGRVGTLFTTVEGTRLPFPDFEVKAEPQTIVYTEVEAAVDHVSV